MDLTRSQFLRLFAGAGVGVLGLSTLAACDDDDNGTPDAPPGDGPPSDTPADMPMANCQMNGTSVTIGTNHGHSLTVSMADVTAGVEKSYQIQGLSAHPHTVIVTAAMFAMLQQNMTVMATSTTDAAHAHSVTISCATA